MTPLEALAVALTGATAALIAYSLQRARSGKSRASEWPFSVLGVDPDDSLDEIKKTYRSLVKKFHPDNLPREASPQVRKLYEERLIKLNTAYKTILSLRAVEPRKLTLREEELAPVEEMLKSARIAVDKEVRKALENAYTAAETLVKSLHRAAGLVGRTAHYYDLLTDLMINDVISVEEFEILAAARRYTSTGNGRENTPKEVHDLVEKLWEVYLKIRRRYIR
ncbi:MAG: DnaJ domain-containing protein [Candidatus Caldarchaeum sp.]|uniref:J domain-containing protein n=1 Tax=Caldiarchaeum subterraneum TaxID=311458 RepID=A0A7J3WBM7_CALS0